MNKLGFRQGLHDGIPIAVGYLSVSFGFGITAVNLGIRILHAVLISMTNLTSAGQVAGLSVIVAGGTLLEMALCQFVINVRYSLMGIALTQRLSDRFSTRHRLLASFFITDEIFAVAVTQRERVTPLYMYGLATLPYVGWSLGTVLGAVAGNLLPASVASALGIAIYGMFVAIVVPPAKEQHGVLLAVVIAVCLSLAIRYVPVFCSISPGFAIILSGVTAAALTAAFVPAKDEGEGAHE